MESYVVELESCGEITQIPDSQKLFGCLMHSFAEFYGDELCSDLVNKIKSKNIEFNLSNVMPKDYFPVPIDYILQNVKCRECINDNNICNQVGKCKKYYQLLKKLKYVTKDDLNQILLGNSKKLLDISSNFNINTIYQQRVHLVNIEDNIKYIKNEPFSVKKLELDVNKFYFLFSIGIKDDCDLHIKDNLFNMLDIMINDNLKVILGQRATQGLNLYKFLNLNTLEIQDKSNCNLYLNMGMLIPNKINYEESYLSLFTSDRRPFYTLGRYHKSDFDNLFISFINQGSVIRLLDSNFNKCVYLNDKLREIVFGNSFLYPINMEQGVIKIV